LNDSYRVDEILNTQPHFIEGKPVECKIAIPKDFIANLRNDLNLTKEQQSSGLYNNSKIFVGGLHPALKENEMKIYFEQFGELEQCVIMHDKPTGKSRGFGFIIYIKESSADLVIQYKNKHSIMGKWVDCKRAMPKEMLGKENSFNNNISSCKTNSNKKQIPQNHNFQSNPFCNNYVVNNYCKLLNIIFRH
jgi:RNA-binding protein Musashi